MLTQEQPLKVYRLKVNLLGTTVTAYTANELGDNGNQVYYLRATDLARLINTSPEKIKEELKIICGDDYEMPIGRIEDTMNYVKVALVDIPTSIKYIVYHAEKGNSKAIDLLFYLGVTLVLKIDIWNKISSDVKMQFLSNGNQRGILYRSLLAERSLGKLFIEAYEEMMTSFYWETFPAISLWV